MGVQPQSIQPSSVEEVPAQTPDANRLDPRVWDGFTLSYAPREKLNISPRVRLHTETAADIDPIAFRGHPQRAVDPQRRARRHDPQGRRLTGGQFRQ